MYLMFVSTHLIDSLKMSADSHVKLLTYLIEMYPQLN